MGVDPTETIEVQNVVGGADLGRELELTSLAMNLERADHDPENFSGLLYRMQNPTATVMLFRSGKVTVAGAASTAELEAAFEEFVTALRELGIPVGDTSAIEVQNIVANADLGERLNLNTIAIELGLQRVEYEPEQFPGLVYRPDALEVIVLLFGSGKIVVTGATERTTIETAVEAVAAQLGDLSLLAG